MKDVVEVLPVLLGGNGEVRGSLDRCVRSGKLTHSAFVVLFRVSFKSSDHLIADPPRDRLSDFKDEAVRRYLAKRIRFDFEGLRHGRFRHLI